MFSPVWGLFNAGYFSHEKRRLASVSNNCRPSRDPLLDGQIFVFSRRSPSTNMTSNNKATLLLFETKKSPPLLGPVEIYGSKQQARAISLRTTRTVSLEIDLGEQKGEEEEDSPFPFKASVEVRSNTPLTVTRLLLLSQKGERKRERGKKKQKEKKTGRRVRVPEN